MILFIRRASRLVNGFSGNLVTAALFALQIKIARTPPVGSALERKENNKKGGNSKKKGIVARKSRHKKSRNSGK